MVICPICHTRNGLHETICTHCGERLTRPSSPPAYLGDTPAIFDVDTPSLLSDAPPPEMDELPMPGPRPSHVSTAPPRQRSPSTPQQTPPAVPLRLKPPPSPSGRHQDTPVRMSVVPHRGLKPTPRDTSTRTRPKAKPAASSTEQSPGHAAGARLVVYQNRRPVHTYRLAHDETLIGRYDPIGGSEPELDLTPFDTVGASSRKHAYIYRQNNQFYLYPISNAGTQVGDEWVQLGQKRLLVDGDVIVLSMKVAIRFHTGDAT